MERNIPPYSFEYVPEECLRKIADALDCAGATDYKVFAEKLDKSCNFSLGFSKNYLHVRFFVNILMVFLSKSEIKPILFPLIQFKSEIYGIVMICTNIASFCKQIQGIKQL